MIKIEHLTKNYGNHCAVDDINLEIGEGEIGLEAIAAFLNHSRLKGLPAILETPNELSGYAREIALLRGQER